MPVEVRLKISPNSVQGKESVISGYKSFVITKVSVINNFFIGLSTKATAPISKSTIDL